MLRKCYCVRTRIVQGAVADGDEQGDGAVVGPPAPHAFAEFRGEPGDQRMTGSAKGFRAGIPIVEIDVDRDGRHHNVAIGAVCKDRGGS